MSKAESAKFFPAFFVEIVNDGDEFASGELPLHMTLFPPIQQEYDPSYAVEMRRVLNPLVPFDVAVGENDRFGKLRLFRPRRPDPVKLIEPSERLQKVHNGIVFTLGTLLHDPSYRQPYRPHVSVKNFDQVESGSIIHVGGFSIVEKRIGQSWVVRDKVGFRGEEPS